MLAFLFQLKCNQTTRFGYLELETVIHFTRFESQIDFQQNVRPFNSIAMNRSKLWHFTRIVAKNISPNTYGEELQIIDNKKPDSNQLNRSNQLKNGNFPYRPRLDFHTISSNITVFLCSVLGPILTIWSPILNILANFGLKWSKLCPKLGKGLQILTSMLIEIF